MVSMVLVYNSIIRYLDFIFSLNYSLSIQPQLIIHCMEILSPYYVPFCLPMGTSYSSSTVLVYLFRCRLKLLKLERIKDFLLLEEEFIQNQERLRPQEEKTEEERGKVDELRASPMDVGEFLTFICRALSL